MGKNNYITREEISDKQKSVIDYIDEIANKRSEYINKNKYYYEDLIKFFRHNISDLSRVLEIGCGTGYVLNAINPKNGAGIDVSEKMIAIARKEYPQLSFFHQAAEDMDLGQEKFDYVIISDTLGYFEDIQKVFSELKKVITSDTRVIITYHSFLWQPFLKMAEYLKLKMPQKRLNWLNDKDIKNLLNLEDFDVIKTGKRFLMPKKIFGLSYLINKYLAFFPLFNRLCLTGFIVARLKEDKTADEELRVSVVIPARNEKGNIEEAVKRISRMGKETEIIFIEGGSTDGTLNEIKRVVEYYKDKIPGLTIKYDLQSGRGKGDAVRKGFAIAQGDILMILDADLTVPPEDLPKFFNAITSNKGEFINGSRLVYPMEDEAMMTLNIIGNTFFSWMFTWLLGQRFKDTLCGTKAISNKNYQKLIANRKYFGDFDPFGDFDLIFGAAKLNLKIIEIPIRYQARQYGQTNISRFRHGWLLIKMVLFAMRKIKFI
jgi:ubiquinone/menaquinone biosynthesis C-methylase UbiE